jgi:general secretion pathway protein K
MNRRRTHSRGSEDGIALLLVLVFVALLSVLVVEYAYESNVDSAVTQAHLTQQEAYLAARSGVAAGMSLLTIDLYDEIETGIGSDTYVDAWAYGVPLEEINEIIYRCGIDDEAGKLNVNALIDAQGQGVEETDPLYKAFEAMFEAREPEVNPIDAIIDWIDADDEPRPNGAEFSDYELGENEFRPPNAPLASVEELLMVAGMTPELYFGLPDEEGYEEQLPLSELVTTHLPIGDFTVNANTAEYEVVAALQIGYDGLLPGPDELLEEREANPFNEMAHFRERGYVRDEMSFPEEIEAANQNNQQQGQSRTQNQNQNQQQGQNQNQQQGQNQNQQQSQNPVQQTPRIEVFPYKVDSDTFRIHGDALAGDTQVRIEAFVRRARPDGGAAAGESMVEIIDWRVIR